MKKEELIGRGQMNINDAFFVKDNFIPIALEMGKWSIVVYESYRVIELVIKGIMRIAGIEPLVPQKKDSSKFETTHDIERLLSQFKSKLAAKEEHIPYFLALKSPSGNNFYGIELVGVNAHLYKFIAGIWTQIGSPINISSLSIEELINLQLKCENNILTISHNDNILTQQTVSSFSPQRLIFEMSFQRLPDNERITKIIEIGKKLFRNRTQAFYSEKVYNDEDAQKAITNMNDALDASKSFLIDFNS